MSDVASLFEACGELFGSFPQAVRNVGVGSTIRSMVLLVRDGDDARFFVLAQHQGEGGPVYSLRPWPAGDAIYIDAAGVASVPDGVASAVMRGVPLPRHGSIFGWADQAAFEALIVTYTDSVPGRPLPRWSVMPLAGRPESRWPSFTSTAFFGQWFWDDFRAGSIVLLDHLISETPDSIFWVNTQAILGSDCCAVARDIQSPDGHVLRRGRYVYSEALRLGSAVPSLTALLADPGKLDMAPRFRRLERSMLLTEAIYDCA
jgi:hypothetical protein